MTSDRAQGSTLSPRPTERHIRRSPYGSVQSGSRGRGPVTTSPCSLAQGGVSGRSHGVIVLGRSGLVKDASDEARRWLREYFGAPADRPARLPEAIRGWLRGRLGATGDHAEPRGRAFSVERNGRRLVVRLIPDRAQRFLLLEEHAPAPSATGLKSFRLTRREAEVLAWVAVGKTNQDIAAILAISSRTVKKHLEHVYQKLGVETRTAAAAVFAFVSPARPVPEPGDLRERRSASAERRIDRSVRAPYVRHTDPPHAAS